jgi:3-oxoacyl-[acyl-carrier protein] reductase
MNLGLNGKVVLVTGGTRGIGAAICEGFAAEGAHVAYSYVSASSRKLAEELTARLRKNGVRAGDFAADTGKADEVLALIDAAEREVGEIDILVNNAAVCPKGPITSYSLEEWERTFAVNVSGAFLATREVVSRLLAKKKPGAVVNIVSQAAFRGSTTGHLPYDSSKGALVSFTVGLAREVSAQGIRVNAVAPGLVLTEMVAKTWEERKEHYLRNIPIGRIAKPEEIADAVVFLASDRAGYITGATLDISGGMMMR